MSEIGYFSRRYPFERKTEGASGFDLHALIDEPVTVPAHDHQLIPTGIHLVLPVGIEAQIRPRSGMSRQGLVAALGTIDADFRGDCTVNLFNLVGVDQVIEPGDRIAQIVFVRIVLAPFNVELKQIENERDIPMTVRGAQGWGSTGK